MSSCDRRADRSEGQGRKGEKKRVVGHVEFLEHEEVMNDDTCDNNDVNRDKVDLEMSSLSLVQSLYTRQASKEERKKIRQQKTASAVVTGGALTFVVLVAVLVTASLLMSPVIEELFGKDGLKNNLKSLKTQFQFLKSSTAA